MKNLISLCLILLGLNSFAGIGEKNHELTLNLKKGETYFQNTSADLLINQTVQGTPMLIKTIITGKMSYKVINIENETFEMEANYLEMAMTMTMPMGSMKVHSNPDSSATDPGSKMMSDLFKGMINKPFIVFMKKDGTVKEIKGLEQLIKSTMESSGIPAAQQPQMEAALAQSFSEDGLKGNMEMASAIFPGKKVAVNDEWKKNVDLKGQMKAAVETTYKLTDYNENEATIEGSATIQTSDKEDYQDINGMQAKYDMSGTLRSSFKIDPLSGWIIRAEVKQNMEGNIDFKDSPAIPGGMKVPLSVDSNTIITK